MITVKTKFVVQKIERTAGGPGGSELQTITLAPVSADSPENALFWAYTPVGEIQLGTVKAGAAAVFDISKAYYVEFTPAEDVAGN